MESPLFPTSPPLAGDPFKSRPGTKDDMTSLTSFNPFSEEDENDQSSYTLVTSLFSRVRNTLAAPLSSAVTAGPGASTASNSWGNGYSTESRRSTLPQSSSANHGPRLTSDRPHPLKSVGSANAVPAPPLVSRVPVVSESPTFNTEHDRPPSRGGFLYSPSTETHDGGMFGTTIPGFPIQDDTRSIHTNASLKRSASVSKVIRKIRGEGALLDTEIDEILSVNMRSGLSRDYWMDDENCKECYDCKSVFTTWRRKHHCRICGMSNRVYW